MNTDEFDKPLNIDEILQKTSKENQELIKKLLKNMKEKSDKIIKKLKEDTDNKLKEKDKEIEKIKEEKDKEIEKTKEEKDKEIEKIKEDSNQKLKEKEEIIKEKEEQIKQLENNYFDRDRLSEEIKTKIEKVKSKFTEKEQEEISELQLLLTGNNKKNKIFENYSIKRAFDYKFGNSIENDNFISYIKEGISTLYSNDNMNDINNGVFEFFKNISRDIKEFLYIPMINNNTLYELKKYIYLAIISNQLKLYDYDLLPNYIFYNESYFNESVFEEITVNIKNDNTLLKYFPEYGQSTQIKINLETIRDYLFSKAIQEAYYETFKEIFGPKANFVTKENIKNASENIYENIVKNNLIFVKLEDGYFGITLYSKKILIKNSFIMNIKNSTNERKKVTLLAALIMTILHEISHCLSNYLPLYDKEYEGLSNPFIRTFKKNLAIFDYVKGTVITKDKKNIFDLLKEIKDYELIQDSGTHFEKKLFNDFYNKNYLSYEYFLRKEHLDCSLKEFNDNFENFKKKFSPNEIISLNKEAPILSRKNEGYFCYGGCFLDPDGISIMK